MAAIDSGSIPYSRIVALMVGIVVSGVIGLGYAINSRTPIKSKAIEYTDPYATGIHPCAPEHECNGPKDTNSPWCCPYDAPPLAPPPVVKPPVHTRKPVTHVPAHKPRPKVKPRVKPATQERPFVTGRAP